MIIKLNLWNDENLNLNQNGNNAYLPTRPPITRS